MRNRIPINSPYRHKTRIIEPPNPFLTVAFFALVVGFLVADMRPWAALTAALHLGGSLPSFGRAPTWHPVALSAVLFSLVGGAALRAGELVLTAGCLAGVLVALAFAATLAMERVGRHRVSYSGSPATEVPPTVE